MSDTATLTPEQQIALLQKELAEKNANQPPVTLNSTPLKTRSIGAFMASNGFTAWSGTTRQSVNERPYVTFVNEAVEKQEIAAAAAENRPVNPSVGKENIYFSRRASASIVKGTEVTIDFLKDYAIADVVNADGEPRTKLVPKSSGRVSLSSLTADLIALLS